MSIATTLTEVKKIYDIFGDLSSNLKESSSFALSCEDILLNFESNFVQLKYKLKVKQTNKFFSKIEQQFNKWFKNPIHIPCHWDVRIMGGFDPFQNLIEQNDQLCCIQDGVQKELNLAILKTYKITDFLIIVFF